MLLFNRKWLALLLLAMLAITALLSVQGSSVMVENPEEELEDDDFEFGDEGTQLLDQSYNQSLNGTYPSPIVPPAAGSEAYNSGSGYQAGQNYGQQPNYGSQGTYEQQQPIYPAVQPVNYQPAQNYVQPQQAYEPVQVTYQQVLNYTLPLASYEPQSTYGPVQQPSYGTVQQPSYAPVQPIYEPVQQVAYQNYSQPIVQQASYAPQQQQTYVPVQQQSYASIQPVQNTYEIVQPYQNYSQPIVQQQSYAPVQPVVSSYEIAQPYQNYSQPIVQQPTYGPIQQPTYGPVQQPSYAPVQPVIAATYEQVQPVAYQNYSQPIVQQPSYAPVQQQSYASVQPQVTTYETIQPVAYQNYSQPILQQQSYAPVQQQSYAQVQPQVTTYEQVQPVITQNYSKPVVQQQSYAPVQQQTYGPVQQQSYAQVQPQVTTTYETKPIVQQQSYAQVQPQVTTTYETKPIVQQQSYVTQNYSKPIVQQQSYVQVPQQTYASAPVQQQNYVQPQKVYKQVQNYTQPIQVQQKINYAPVQPQNNYVKQQAPVYKQQVAIKTNGYKAQKNYASIKGPGSVTTAKYYLGNLATIVRFANYWPNNPGLQYYKAAPYQACPKNIYLNGPTQQDIQEAFRQAKLQLGKVSSSTISYIDSKTQSFAARHAVFSFLNQHSPRMDEEGLLVEYVSQYLAQRACLTKWDKQRYLPTLTKMISVQSFPQSHSCASMYQRLSPNVTKYCAMSKYRTFDGFCNNPYHPYWGKSNVCHIRLMSPDYADGISAPRTSYNPQVPLPNPRSVSTYIHNEIPLDGLYNLMKMQWGQFINHDITNTALSSYDGLVDCCKNPQARGCWPIYVPPGDYFYGKHNVTCLNFIRSGVCALCQLGPRQQSNKNTAFLDLSHIYGNDIATANKLRAFRNGLLIEAQAKNGEAILPLASGSSSDTCTGICFQAGDNRVNQHPALTALHTLLLRRHNQHARGLARRHPDWNDETLFQEARRLAIAEYQMVTYGEYFPIVFGPLLSSYYNLYPSKYGYTQYNPKVDPTTWNEYSTATCRFGHSQISATFGLYTQLVSYKQQSREPTYRLKDWFMQPSFIYEGMTRQLVTGLLSRPADVVDPWITGDVREHLYKNAKDHHGGDLAATNIWRGRDHGIPGYINYLEYCFNHKVYSWKDLEMFIPPQQMAQLKKVYTVVENIDLFTGGLAERHFPGADTGPTFACVNGIQYYHLKFGDRFYFEHANQPGSFNQVQLAAIRQTTLARLLCRTAYLDQVPAYAFLAVSHLNPAVNCNQLGEIDYNLF